MTEIGRGASYIGSAGLSGNTFTGDIIQLVIWQEDAAIEPSKE